MLDLMIWSLHVYEVKELGLLLLLLKMVENGAKVYDVEYCEYVKLRHYVFKKDRSFVAGEFEVLTHSGQSGIGFVAQLVTYVFIYQEARCFHQLQRRRYPHKFYQSSLLCTL
ncbi:hypothetical protein RIF29_21517 [Crotalaria pallida]|uniref:Uncharacterized protein n=1 Tax=Crotalaria pallida TaxID=3830 RepID=A0AAN9I607_CROPI